MKIKAPFKGYTRETTIGAVTLTFNDGVAHVEEISDGMRAYLDSRGYEVIEGEEDEQSETDEFDPSKHSVQDVMTYLNSEGITEEERERVLTAEREGQKRKTIVGGE